MKKFNDVYLFPLRFDESADIVWTANNGRAMDFPIFGSDDELMLHSAMYQKIVNKLNGKQTDLPALTLIWDGNEANILCEGKIFCTIRGWGYLTGTGGGLALPVDEAVRLQNEFAQFIIQTLSK
jgi:hypothetical protein